MLILILLQVASTSDLIFKAIIGTIVGGTGLYKLLEFILQKHQERKDKEIDANLIRKKVKLEQDNKLELNMFDFDKEKYIDSKTANEQFQKDIINEIFTKFVHQTEWIQKIHDQSIESIKNDVRDLNKTVTDIYIQNDVLSNRIRNIEDRVLKGNTTIIAKLDSILIYFQNKKNDKK